MGLTDEGAWSKDHVVECSAEFALHTHLHYTHIYITHIYTIHRFTLYTHLHYIQTFTTYTHPCNGKLTCLRTTCIKLWAISKGRKVFHIFISFSEESLHWYASFYNFQRNHQSAKLHAHLKIGFGRNRRRSRIIEINCDLYRWCGLKNRSPCSKNA